MPEPQVTEGQAAASEPEGTTVTAPGGGEGQSAGTQQTTGNGTAAQTQTGETFFDPKSIEHSPELMQAYKQMQSAFSKKTAGIRGVEDKVRMYDQFMADPAATLRQLAPQYGMTLVDGQPAPSADGQDFAPQSWADVEQHITQQVMSKLNQAYEPLVGEVKNLKQKNIEQYLDTQFADWRTYESEMIANLQQHPSMANDPDLLYEMSIPREIREARATERALAKLKGSSDAGAVGGTKNASQVTSDRPEGKLSFNEAVQFAKNKLRKSGITPMAG